MKIILVSAAVVAILAPAACAQEDAVSGAASGAVTGAVVGGPVGAAVGGVVGAIAGSAAGPPQRRGVRYVERVPICEDPVVVRKRAVAGKPIPAPVVVTPIPNARHYAYGVVNQQWILVDPGTRRKVARVIR